MGGDYGPAVVIPGAALSLDRHPGIQFIFFGDAARIEAELDKHPALKAQSSVAHTSTTISMDDKPSQALRRGKGSSMWLALECVQKGQAQAAISAGNTGALMAIARLVLRPMADIERPAIAAIWPTVKRGAAQCRRRGNQGCGGGQASSRLAQGDGSRTSN